MKAKLRQTQLKFSAEDGLETVVLSERAIKRMVAVTVGDISGIKLSKAANGIHLGDLFHSGGQGTSGVYVKFDKDRIRVAVDLVVEYGIGIPGMTKNIQDRIKEAIENMTGVEVESVDIRIVDANIL